MEVVVDALIVKNNKILMVQEGKKEKVGRYQKWNLPGGRIEKGEHPINAVKRELLEETNCKIEPKGILPIIRISNNWGDFFLIVYVSEIIEEKIKYDTKEIQDVKWIEIDEIKNKKIPQSDENIMNKIISNYEKNKIFSLDAFDEEIFI